MKKLFKIWNGLKSRLSGISREIVPGSLAGIPLKVVNGTLRAQPDQDDAWLFYLLGQFDRIFDIGANIGLTALMAKVQEGSRKLLLADPNTQALSIAARNLIWNGFATKCDFVTAFVSDTDGEEIPFWTVGVGAAGSMYRGHADTASVMGQSMLVPTLTLDTIMKQVGWTPEFVKIDVEGAEAKVLQGAKRLATRHKPWFMVEMHSPPELPMVENARLVLSWASESGYAVWYMRDAVRMYAPDLIADRGKCHLLLLPLETQYPNTLKNTPQGAPIPTLI